MHIRNIKIFKVVLGPFHTSNFRRVECNSSNRRHDATEIQHSDRISIDKLLGTHMHVVSKAMVKGDFLLSNVQSPNYGWLGQQAVY